jgi:Pyrimidine dimer DNA glycosylase
VQTFLPHPDFAESAAALDGPRLGKQRVETLQILRALHFPEYGWANHPAVRMWAGREPALVAYGLACAAEWMRRGHADTTAAQIAEFAPEVVGRSQDELARAAVLPSWLGDAELHESHRSRLLAKDGAFYAEFAADTRPGLDYVWPQPDLAVVSPRPRTGERIWVVRAETPAVLGRFVGNGMVGVDGGSGVDLDVTGLDAGQIRELVPPRRRRSKPVAALIRLVAEMEPGDAVAVPIEDGASLLRGVLDGGYRFRRPTADPILHQRPVRWRDVVPRSAVEPPAALQDPRTVFPVWLAGPEWPESRGS